MAATRQLPPPQDGAHPARSGLPAGTGPPRAYHPLQVADLVIRSVQKLLLVALLLQQEQGFSGGKEEQDNSAQKKADEPREVALGDGTRLNSSRFVFFPK